MSTRTDAGARARRYTIEGQSVAAPPLEPGLYVTATPIGNLGDVTLRALATLAAADGILCEDTRVTRRLTAHFGIATPLAAYHEHNAARARPGILARLEAGEAIALVSDAGTPLISDPGFKLVREAREAGIAVTAVPGASAAVAAVSIAGLPSDRFLFAGFLPARGGERRRALERLMAVEASIVLYEAPQRIENLLTMLDEVAPDRELAVTRELTKRFEEVLTGVPAEVGARLEARDGVKGEVTVVIAPPAQTGTDEPDRAAVDEALRRALGRQSTGKAAAEVARAFGLNRRDVYARALELKDAEEE
ncbi:16S rRNA (cytidine(1402)-2'-O)-methyltransferase [Kaustia mangrovi]|uniref:Ribosomal RNA small subunit methyltransferase I n=1 Tax=Kaustia mangrovi TaxID=2593653 RepID=A0A7S8C575_9HYPH|nr:16S rRNA (cytidine(1402)-2'-O)-methyltransferase [Kaustia mangrovi]QPC43414.1 16S rRNA (cytidine(1402)-2'-O)-methyltransferase [Kaustia mangrovi]